MYAIIQKGIYTIAELERINRVRKFKGIHLLGDMVLCNGQTVNCGLLDCELTQSSQEFSVKKPTATEFKLFCQAISLASLSSNYIPRSLGQFICWSHMPDKWFSNDDRTELYFWQVIRITSYIL